MPVTDTNDIPPPPCVKFPISIDNTPKNCYTFDSTINWVNYIHSPKINIKIEENNIDI